MVNEQAKSLVSILEEKEAILERERTMLEELKAVLDRMGYELVPKAEARRPVRRRQAAATPELTAGSRRRGRPPKAAVAEAVAS